MFKKILPVLLVLIFSQYAAAIDKEDVNIDYFARFNDDCLVYYVNQAFENNHDLKKAAAVVEQYRQQVKYSFGNELPNIGVSANYLGVKIPELDNFSLKKNAFILPFMLNYEPDFLLKNRDKTKSIRKSYESELYDEKAVYISLLSDVASVYTNILQYDKLINIAQKNVGIYSTLMERDNQKLSAGIINSSQMNNAKKDYESAKQKLENYKKEQTALLMQLMVLTGNSPDNISGLRRGNFDDFEYQEVIPSEIESDVIFSRPDVLAAEAKLEKARIDVRVARKELLPSFNITGLWIFNTIAPGTFFSWESSLAAIFAGASQDIFAGGKKIANLKMKKAKYEELFEAYRQTDLEAVKEVNTALCLIKHDSEIENSAKNKYKYDYRNFKSDEKRLKQGVISYPRYLESSAALLSSESDMLNAKNHRLADYFTLYKTVGGKL